MPQMHENLLYKNAIKCHAHGDLVNAEKYYREAINSGATNSALFSNLGVICQKTQRTEEAISLYKKAIQINPNNPTAHLNLGGIHKDLGNLDLALASTLKSLELNPDNPTSHLNLGGIHKDLGNLDLALASILKSLELKPDNPDALSKLLNLYGEGDFSKLGHIARRAIESNKEILNNLSYIEAVSSLGKDIAKDIIFKKRSNN